MKASYHKGNLHFGRMDRSHTSGWLVYSAGDPAGRPQMRVWDDGFTAWLTGDFKPYSPTEAEVRRALAGLPEEAVAAIMRRKLSGEPRT